MQNLNEVETVSILDEDGFDTLTVVNLGGSISLAQVTEDQRLMDVIIGFQQAKMLLEQMGQFV